MPLYSTDYPEVIPYGNKQIWHINIEEQSSLRFDLIDFKMGGYSDRMTIEFLTTVHGFDIPVKHELSGELSGVVLYSRGDTLVTLTGSQWGNKMHANVTVTEWKGSLIHFSKN